MTDAEFCGGSQGSGLSGLAVAIEFDADSNMNTGCAGHQGYLCYGGAEYQIWVFGDNSTEFKIFNQTKVTNGECNNIGQGDCFSSAPAGNSTYNITFNYTCGGPSSPYILRIAVNRSAITNLTGMNFMTNSFVYGQPPSDTLGGFGEDKFEMG